MSEIKNRPLNPFYIGINIPDEFFCDRKKETQIIIDKLKNQTNIVLKAPRRLGKSSLLKHIFNQDDIKTGYNTLFVDVYGTRTMNEFISVLQNAFLDAPFARTEAAKRKIESLIKGINLQAHLNEAGYFTGVSAGINSIQQQTMTLKQMFDYLENTKKPNIVVFDEFQQINEYPERAAAILRSHVQQSNNTRFIFSGSERHLLDHMFENNNEPLYKSASSINLSTIKLSAYEEFCKHLFNMYGKNIEEDAIELTYVLFSGNTYDMQIIMRDTFPKISKGKSASKEDILTSINEILDDNDIDYRSRLNQIENIKTRQLFFCIAKEGIASGLTSGPMMKLYNLDNASVVQNGLTALQSNKLNLISKVGKSSYQLNDRFFELWLARTNKLLDQKIKDAYTRFNKENNLKNQLLQPTVQQKKP